MDLFEPFYPKDKSQATFTNVYDVFDSMAEVEPLKFKRELVHFFDFPRIRLRSTVVLQSLRTLAVGPAAAMEGVEHQHILASESGWQASRQRIKLY